MRNLNYFPIKNQKKYTVGTKGTTFGIVNEDTYSIQEHFLEILGDPRLINPEEKKEIAYLIENWEIIDLFENKQYVEDQIEFMYNNNPKTRKYIAEFIDPLTLGAGAIGLLKGIHSEMKSRVKGGGEGIGKGIVVTGYSSLPYDKEKHAKYGSSKVFGAIMRVGTKTLMAAFGGKLVKMGLEWWSNFFDFGVADAVRGPVGDKIIEKAVKTGKKVVEMVDFGKNNTEMLLKTLDDMGVPEYVQDQITGSIPNNRLLPADFVKDEVAGHFKDVIKDAGFPPENAARITKVLNDFLSNLPKEKISAAEAAKILKEAGGNLGLVADSFENNIEDDFLTYDEKQDAGIFGTKSKDGQAMVNILTLMVRAALLTMKKENSKVIEETFYDEGFWNKLKRKVKTKSERVNRAIGTGAKFLAGVRNDRKEKQQDTNTGRRMKNAAYQLSPEKIKNLKPEQAEKLKKVLEELRAKAEKSIIDSIQKKNLNHYASKTEGKADMAKIYASLMKDHGFTVKGIADPNKLLQVVTGTNEISKNDGDSKGNIGSDDKNITDDSVGKETGKTDGISVDSKRVKIGKVRQKQLPAVLANELRKNEKIKNALSSIVDLDQANFRLGKDSKTGKLVLVLEEELFFEELTPERRAQLKAKQAQNQEKSTEDRNLKDDSAKLAYKNTGKDSLTTAMFNYVRALRKQDIENITRFSQEIIKNGGNQSILKKLKNAARPGVDDAAIAREIGIIQRNMKGEGQQPGEESRRGAGTFMQPTAVIFKNMKSNSITKEIQKSIIRNSELRRLINRELRSEKDKEREIKHVKIGQSNKGQLTIVFETHEKIYSVKSKPGIFAYYKEQYERR